MLEAPTVPKAPGAQCETCPARAGKFVPPETSSHVRLAIVGEGPGRNELEAGRPFVGASGRMLMRGMASIGLKRADVHWTNAVLCDCKEDDLPAAAKACAPRLRAELAAVAAPVVMPVGAFGLQSALALPKRPQILKWRGSISEARYGEAHPSSYVREAYEIANSVECRTTLVCPTVHPAFVMRSPQWGPVLEIDVDRVGRLLAMHARGERWRAPEDDPSRRTIVARDEATLTTTLDALQIGDVGFDVETVGLGPTETLLVCFAISDGTTTVVVPWSRGRDGRERWWGLSEARVARQITAAMAKRVAVTHNGPAFDHIVADRYAVLATVGVEVTRWDDTLLATHSLASHMPKNLAHVVTLGLDVPPWKQLEDRTATLERLWAYNARDTLYTILRWHQLRDELRAA